MAGTFHFSDYLPLGLYLHSQGIREDKSPPPLRTVHSATPSTAAATVLRGGSGWVCALSQEVGLRDWHKASSGRWLHTTVPSLKAQILATLPDHG